METLFITSPDHVRRAYDQIGNRATNFLVHGEGSNRQAWLEVSYVERLREELTVISLDLRGYGESDLPTDQTDFTTGKMGRNIQAIADAFGVECFIIWGLSFIVKISRYLATKFERIAKIVLMGVKRRPGVSDEIPK